MFGISFINELWYSLNYQKPSIFENVDIYFWYTKEIHSYDLGISVIFILLIIIYELYEVSYHWKLWHDINISLLYRNTI